MEIAASCQMTENPQQC